jgi:hypothetical protein
VPFPHRAEVTEQPKDCCREEQVLALIQSMIAVS